MTEMIREPALCIDGKWVPGGGGDAEVEDPTTEEVTGLVTRASGAEVEQAVSAARTAFDGWASRR